MPIDVSHGPYDGGGPDPDDLSLAGKGAAGSVAAAGATDKVATDKAIGSVDDHDDDLTKAGQGAGAHASTAFVPHEVDKGDDILKHTVDHPLDHGGGDHHTLGDIAADDDHVKHLDDDLADHLHHHDDPHDVDHGLHDHDHDHGHHDHDLDKDPGHFHL